MLGMKNYTQKYRDECRSKVDVELSAYKKLVAAAKSHPASVQTLETFDATCFNNIMTADNVGKIAAFAGLNAIKLNPTKSVLKYRAGDESKLNEADFLLLSKAFFAEIESKYV